MLYQVGLVEERFEKLNSIKVSAGGLQPDGGHGCTASPAAQFVPLESQPVFGQSLPAQPSLGMA